MSFASTVLIGSFVGKEVLDFYCSRVVSVLRFTNEAIGTKNVLKVNNLFNRLLTAALASKNFAI